MRIEARNATWAEVVDALPSTRMAGTTVRVLRLLDVRIDPPTDLAEHEHTWWEFSLVQGGSVTYRLAQREVPVEEGHAIVIPPGTPHGWRTHGGTLIGSLHIHVDAGWAPDIAATGDPTLTAMFAAMRTLADGRVRSWKEQLVALLQAVIHRFADKAGPRAANPSAPSLYVDRAAVSVVQRAKHHASEALGRSLSIDDIARACSVSPRHLRRLFSEGGENLAAWIAHERRSRAVQRLKYSSEPIAVVAAALGYRDAASFSRAFRRWIGCSPGAFRRHCRHETVPQVGSS